MMVSVIEAPGAAGTASEGNSLTGHFHSADYRMRAEWASAAAYALEKCHAYDAAQLCAGILDAMQTDGPPMGDTWGLVVSDARLWADIAPAHEVVAYGAASLDRLRGLAVGLNTRKRLFVRLWEGFSPKDRQAFLSRLDANGQLLRREAA